MHNNYSALEKGRHLFAEIHCLIDPNSSERRFATTTIHFVRKPANPMDTLIGAISGAILDAASESFTQRIMELAISSAKHTDTPVATDMGLSRSGLKMGKATG